MISACDCISFEARQMVLQFPITWTMLVCATIAVVRAVLVRFLQTKDPSRARRQPSLRGPPTYLGRRLDRTARPVPHGQSRHSAPFPIEQIAFEALRRTLTGLAN